MSFKVYNPLPLDAFDEDELLVEDDKTGDEIEFDVFDREIDDFGNVISKSYNIAYFCEWFGCNIRNQDVCQWCGVGLVYFSIEEH